MPISRQAAGSLPHIWKKISSKFAKHLAKQYVYHLASKFLSPVISNFSLYVATIYLMNTVREYCLIRLGNTLLHVVNYFRKKSHTDPW